MKVNGKISKQLLNGGLRLNKVLHYEDQNSEGKNGTDQKNKNARGSNQDNVRRSTSKSTVKITV